MTLYPLPDLMLFQDYDGKWDLYQEAVYQEFLNKIENKISFLGLPIKCKRFQLINGMHRSFWHIITENRSRSMNDEDRTVDTRRCERIGWIPHIIKNHTHDDVKYWENTRKNNTNVVLWLMPENYMIILSKREGYYLLTTAYINDEFTRKKNIREMNENLGPRNF